jgi:hypothetical protein
VFGFELNQGMLNVPPSTRTKSSVRNRGAATSELMLSFVQPMIVNLYEGFVARIDAEAAQGRPRAYDIARIILEEIRIVPNDFVVLKVDFTPVTAQR